MKTAPFLLALLPAVFAVPGALHAEQTQTLPEVRISIRSPGDPPVALPAAALNSGLPLTWSVAAGPAKIAGTSVMLEGGYGGVTLKATQPGDGEWDPLEAYVTFAVTEDGGFVESTGFSDSLFSQPLSLTRHGMLLERDSSYGNRLSPVRPEMKWRTAARSSNHTLAVAEDGSLWAWGANHSGQFGLGGTRPSHVFWKDMIRLMPDSTWRSTAAHGNYSLAIKKDGTLWGWGGTPPRPPWQVSPATNWSAIRGALNSTVALQENGTLWYFTGYSMKSMPAGGVTAWRDAGSSMAGEVGVAEDGALWHHSFGSGLTPLSTEADWLQTSVGRRHYLALREDGSLWGGPMLESVRPKGPPPPAPVIDGIRWTKIFAGFEVSEMISEDGALWRMAGLFSAGSPEDTDPVYAPVTAAGSPVFKVPSLLEARSRAWLYRVAPDFFPQRVSFLENQEQPLPVVEGASLTVPENALNSGLPPAVSVLSGPAVLNGHTLTFTGPGLVEVAFTRPWDHTWSALDQKIIFLSGPPGPEIAVHDGPDTAGPVRSSGAPLIQPPALTRAAAAKGVTRSFTILNTGAEPLRLGEISVEENGGVFTVASALSAAVLPPGESARLDLTFRATGSAEYGKHPVTVRVHSNDSDEAVYRLPFEITLSNTAPFASAGPDRVIPAGRTVRLAGAFFSSDDGQPASTLEYAWDLDGTGWKGHGASQQITLTVPGESRKVKLRVTDADGFSSFSECIITAGPAHREASPAIRLNENRFSEIIFPGVPGGKYEVWHSRDPAAREKSSPSDSSALPVECGPDGFFFFRRNSGDSRGFFRAVRVE